jgi:hypothetical protein
VIQPDSCKLNKNWEFEERFSVLQARSCVTLKVRNANTVQDSANNKQVSGRLNARTYCDEEMAEVFVPAT